MALGDCDEFSCYGFCSGDDGFGSADRGGGVIPRSVSRYDRIGEHALARGASLEEIPIHLSAPYRYLRDELTSIRAHYPRSPRLIDFCCGTGAHSVMAASLGYDVLGIDLSAKSVEAAVALANRAGFADRCSFQVGDAVKLLREAAPVDVIFCSGSLYYFDAVAVARDIREKLLPGGHFLCVETNGSNGLMKTYRRVRHAFRGHRDERTLGHLIKLPEFIAACDVFDECEIRLFDFFALAGAPLKRVSGLARIYHKLATGLDSFVLNRLGRGSLAFKVTLHARKF